VTETAAIAGDKDKRSLKASLSFFMAVWEVCGLITDMVLIALEIPFAELILHRSILFVLECTNIFWII